MWSRRVIKKCNITQNSLVNQSVIFLLTLFSSHYGLILITVNFLLVRFTLKHTLPFSKVRAVPSTEYFLNSGYLLDLKALPCNYTVTLTKKN